MFSTRIFCLFFCLCLALLFSANAVADECQTLADNANWNDGMTTLSEQMKAKQWDDALKTAETLNAICERSPMLNYLMGHVYKEKGNDSKALYYMQRATLFTEEFAVKGKTLEKMWFDRYEAEHPEARPEVIARTQNELIDSKQMVDKLTKENIKLKGDVSTTSLGSKLETLENDEVERRHYATGMWMGVGIGAAGLALTIAGGVMAFKGEKHHVMVDTNSDAKFSSDVAINLGLFGAGIALLVTGVIFTGYFGYHYTHLSAVENLAINITPNSASLSFNF